MRLGVYVGSFNPPHNGHLKVVNYLLDNNYLDKVVILPAPNNYDKRDLVDVKYRTEMLRIFETDKIIIDDIHNKKYTYEELNEVQGYYKDATLYLIVGADNLAELHLWKNVEEILKYNIIVLKRGNIDIEECLEKFDRSKFTIVDNFPFIDISSTKIRDGNDDNLDPRVLQYIKKNKLYGRK